MALKRYQFRPAPLRDPVYKIEAAAGRVFPYNTAVTLRLTTSIHRTNRTVVGDSAFSSVSTAGACQQYGLHFMGIIKTAHKQYPKNILKAWAHNQPRGSHHVMQATPVERPIYALAWNDKKLKLFVFTRGTTIDAEPAVRKRARLDEDGRTREFELEIPRPRMVKMFFDGFNAVDTNDQYRQGILKLEENWKTHSWATRTFTTILGVIFVNSHLAMRLTRDNDATQDPSTFKEDMGKLAYLLIFNPYLVDEARDLRNRGGDNRNVETPEELRGSHISAHLHDTSKYRELPKMRARMRCSICQKLTRQFCVDCSDDNHQKYVAVCAPGTKKDGVSLCYYEHKRLV